MYMSVPKPAHIDMVSFCVLLVFVAINTSITDGKIGKKYLPCIPLIIEISSGVPFVHCKYKLVHISKKTATLQKSKEKDC